MRLLVLSICLCLLAGCAGSRKADPIPYVAPAGVVHAGEYLPARSPEIPALYLQSWLPADAPPKALVLYVPANVEHGGLIAPIAGPLAQAGYGVFAVDLRGLGRSTKDGDFFFVRNHDDYVADIADTAAVLRERFPGLAVHGAGESLGAALLLRADIQGAVRFDSLVLADTAFQPNPGLGVLPLPDFMARGMVWTGGQIGKALPFMPSVPARFSINAVACSKNTRGNLLRDPYVVREWLPAAFISTLADTQRVLGDGLEKVSTPMMVLHGGKDGVIPVRSSREIVRRVASSEKLLFVIPDGCHATMLEDNTREHVLRMTKEWLAKRAPKTAPANPAALLP